MHTRRCAPVRLPAYSAEFDPVEWNWLALRERTLTVSVFSDYEASLDVC